MSNPVLHTDPGLDGAASGPLSAQLRITEIFYSLQGEARTVGLPTVFVRLTGCPLRCVYCDTEYAFSGGELFTLEHVLGEVARHDRTVKVPWRSREHEEER